MSESYKGGCFCGAVEIEASGAPEAMGYCHCGSCRLFSGAPLVTFVMFQSDNVRVLKGEEHLDGYNKTGVSDRRFCAKCGGHLMSHHPQWGLTDVYAAALPTLKFEPSMHVNYASAVLPVRDGLPKLKDFPAEAGGSGELLEE
jgi:hypothetical protein